MRIKEKGLNGNRQILYICEFESENDLDRFIGSFTDLVKRVSDYAERYHDPYAWSVAAELGSAVQTIRKRIDHRSRISFDAWAVAGLIDRDIEQIVSAVMKANAITVAESIDRKRGIFPGGTNDETNH